MKGRPDINDTAEGEDAVRARHDHAAKYQKPKKANGKAQEQVPGEGATIDDFRAFMDALLHLHATHDLWPAASVNARVPPMPVIDADGKPVLDTKGKPKLMPAAAWLDAHKPVERMTWAPGLPVLIDDRLILESGWVDRKGATCLNLYWPPAIVPGDANKAGPWLDHARKVYPATMPNTSSSGARTASRNQSRRSTTPSCSAVRKASARIPCSSR